MRTNDQIGMALSSLYHRKLRTLLTVLGVTVGTTLVVVVVSLGLGMNAQQEQMLSQMGDLTKITVYANNYSGQQNATVLDDQAVASIAQLDGVQVATPIYRPRNLPASLYTGKNDKYKMELWEVMGMYPEAMEKIGYTLLEGDYPKTQPNAKKPISILIGQYTDFSFFDNSKKNPVYRWPEKNEAEELLQQPFVDMNKDEILFKSNKLEEDSPDSTVVTRELQVAGRMKEDYNKGYETSQGIIMALEDVKALEAAYIKANKIKLTPQQKQQQQGYDNAVVYVETIDDVDSVDTAIQDMGFETNSLESIRKPMQENVRQQQLFLGLLGGVSLVVAAIGITNTMYMSIYERTREIGVMKVLGCQVGSIRGMFLIEAGFIGFIGGLFGAGLSKGASVAINRFGLSMGGTGGMGGGMMGGMGGMEGGVSTSIVPLWLLLAAVGFATLIGLLAGIPPSARATKISALEAIRQS